MTETSSIPCDICGVPGVQWELPQFFSGRRTGSKAAVCTPCADRLTTPQDGLDAGLEPSHLFSSFWSKTTGTLMVAKRSLGAAQDRIRSHEAMASASTSRKDQFSGGRLV